MRVVHVAPCRAKPAEPFTPSVQSLAQAQAKGSSGRVLVVAVADEAQVVRLNDLELRAFRAWFPRRLGRSPALRHHLANCPLELVHAHCPGQRGLHYAHLAAQRHGAPLVVSPGGTFGFGTAEHLQLRCTYHRFVTHPQALEQAAGWHATSAEEASAIHACGFTQPICVAPPGVAIPSTTVLNTNRDWWRRRLPQLNGRPVALCVDPMERRSRLHELVATWGDAFTADWLLLIVGQPGNVSADALADTARRHGAGDRVLIVPPGEAPPHAVAHLLLTARHRDPDLAPIITALASALPVLATDALPWSRLGAEGVGWCVPWKEFGPALRGALRLGTDELAAMGREARDLARREFDWAHTAETLLGFYRHLRT